MARLEARVPHGVLALQLSNEQLRVGAHLDLPVAELLGVLEAEQETLVLGEVVRLLSQEPAEASHDVAGRVDEHRARAGGPRVAPRSSFSAASRVSPCRAARVFSKVSCSAIASKSCAGVTTT